MPRRPRWSVGRLAVEYSTSRYVSGRGEASSHRGSVGDAGLSLQKLGIVGTRRRNVPCSKLNLDDLPEQQLLYARMRNIVSKDLQERCGSVNAVTSQCLIQEGAWSFSN